MPMHPVPAKLKLIRGNPGKRAIKPEVQPKQLASIPEPPDFLLDAAKEEWNRVTAELNRLGLLTMFDLHPLAAYCQAYGRWVCAEKSLAIEALADQAGGALKVKGASTTIQNPLVRIADRAAADMVKYAAEFGFTPVARARLAARSNGGDHPASKFAGLLGG